MNTDYFTHEVFLFDFLTNQPSPGVPMKKPGLWIRIRMFSGPSESGSVIICTDPDLDPSINKQKN
jgi:hypothetical protein